MQQNMLKISDIVVLEQPRKVFSGVDSLAESIQKVGLVQPVAVWHDVLGTAPEMSRYVLVDGEQRLRAFMKLKREEIPVFVVEAADFHAAKEKQMTANLERSDLVLIEKIRGFLGLLTNAPAKYNELVIANKFGLKEKEVKKMVSLARAIDPSVDLHLASGHYDIDDMETLSKVPKQFQPVVMVAANKGSHNVHTGIRMTSEEILFSDVFTLEAARSGGKLHMKDQYSDKWRTFDKTYAAQAKKDFEDTTKKKHAQELQKEKSKTVKEKAVSAEQKKKKAEKEKAAREKSLKELKEAINKAVYVSASEKTVGRILKDNLRKVQGDQLRMLLRAFGIEFKATDCSSDDLRKMVQEKIFGGDDLKPVELVSVIAALDCAGYGIDASTWAKSIRKNL